jgi:hypothetical protein
MSQGRSELREKTNIKGLNGGGRRARSEGEEKLEFEKRIAGRGRRDAAALRNCEGQCRRGPGRSEKRREVQAVVASIMEGGDLLLRGFGARLRDVRIGMRHRAQLRDYQRQGRNYCKTQPQTMLQLWQRPHLRNSHGNPSTARANTECFSIPAVPEL